MPSDMIHEPALVQTGDLVGEYIAVPEGDHHVWLVVPDCWDLTPSFVSWPNGKWKITPLAQDSPLVPKAQRVVRNEKARKRLRNQRWYEAAIDAGAESAVRAAKSPPFELPAPKGNQRSYEEAIDAGAESAVRAAKSPSFVLPAPKEDGENCILQVIVDYDFHHDDRDDEMWMMVALYDAGVPDEIIDAAYHYGFVSEDLSAMKNYEGEDEDLGEIECELLGKMFDAAVEHGYKHYRVIEDGTCVDSTGQPLCGWEDDLG